MHTRPFIRIINEIYDRICAFMMFDDDRITYELIALSYLYGRCMCLCANGNCIDDMYTLDHTGHLLSNLSAKLPIQMSTHVTIISVNTFLHLLRNLNDNLMQAHFMCYTLSPFKSNPNYVFELNNLQNWHLW